jgi:P-type Ca2+ transporter type 2B
LDSNPNTGLALNDATNKCTLYTIVFQSFVFMQLFNQINARKLGAMDLNVFKGFFNNGLFIFIVALTFVVQIAMTQFGGQAVRTVPLTLGQNGICLAIGSLSLIWGVIIKLLLPPSWFASLSMNENEMTDKEESDTINAQLRRSFRQSQQRQSQRGPS